MKNTHLILLSISILANSFIFAQNDEHDGYESTDTYRVKTRQYKDLDISVSYGLGDLTIGSSDEYNLIEGSITYDRRRIQPTVEIEQVGSSGVVTIKAKKDKDKNSHHYKIKDFENEMEFYFPAQIKTDLFLDFGVGDADINLTDISITNLNINCGLSDVEIEINERNDVICESVNIDNGLGDLEIYGLGNLAAENIEINIGLGSAEIDLTGDKIYDTDVNVDIGVGSLDMILPNNANIEVWVDASFLSSVDIYGLKKKKDKYWVSPKWKSSYPTISMDVNVGMGSLDIIIDE